MRTFDWYENQWPRITLNGVGLMAASPRYLCGTSQGEAGEPCPPIVNWVDLLT